MIKFNKSQNVAGVYCIENVVNNMKYIGQSKSIASRWRSHISALGNGKHSSYWLQSDWYKFGEDAFRFYILTIYHYYDFLLSNTCYLLYSDIS